MLILKFYGLIDVLAAVFLFFGSRFPFITFILVVVLIFKGVPSLFADWIGRIYGIVDLIAAVILFFGWVTGIEFIIACVLIFKAIPSFF